MNWIIAVQVSAGLCKFKSAGPKGGAFRIILEFLD